MHASSVSSELTGSISSAEHHFLRQKIKASSLAKAVSPLTYFVTCSLIEYLRRCVRVIKFRGSNVGRKLSSCLNDGEEKLKEKLKEESWCLSLIKPPLNSSLK